MKKNSETKLLVRKLFSDYLDTNNLRHTPERFAILDEIYSNEGHFDVESLYISMRNRNYRVSRATLYNTIELMSRCNLLVKHQFDNKMAQYEKAFNAAHEHLICMRCKTVIEVSDEGTRQLVTQIAYNQQFNISHHALYIYGVCQQCSEKGKKTGTSPELA